MADVSERDKHRAKEIAESWKAEHDSMPVKERMKIDMDVFMVDHLADALAEQRNEFIALARNPYGDDVQCFAGDEPKAVGEKIAVAIEREGQG